MQVVGREVGAEVGPVAVYGAELHQAVGEELLLTVEDLLPREQHLARLVHDPLGDRRVSPGRSGSPRRSGGRSR